MTSTAMTRVSRSPSTGRAVPGMVKPSGRRNSELAWPVRPPSTRWSGSAVTVSTSNSSRSLRPTWARRALPSPKFDSATMTYSLAALCRGRPTTVSPRCAPSWMPSTAGSSATCHRPTESARGGVAQDRPENVANADDPEEFPIGHDRHVPIADLEKPARRLVDVHVGREGVRGVCHPVDDQRSFRIGTRSHHPHQIAFSDDAAEHSVTDHAQAAHTVVDEGLRGVTEGGLGADHGGGNADEGTKLHRC